MEQRIEKIEISLDRVSQAIIEIQRSAERSQIQLEATLSRLADELGKHSDREARLRRVVYGDNGSPGLVETVRAHEKLASRSAQLFWLVVVGASSVFGLFLMDLFRGSVGQ